MLLPWKRIRQKPEIKVEEVETRKEIGRYEKVAEMVAEN